MDHHKKECDAGKTIGCGMSSLSDGFCTICLGKIAPQETALVKGCKHAYCLKCILKWATCHDTCTLCPQCKCPFEFLFVHRTFDGSIHDDMVEECVSLLVSAKWFTKSKIEPWEETEARLEDIDAGPSFGRKKELARNLNRKQGRISLKREAAEMEAAAKYLLGKKANNAKWRNR